MNRYRRGFTLVELMIVVAIISIVASLAVPNLLRYRMNANEGNAAGAMRMIATGEVGYQASAVLDVADDGVGDFGVLEQLADPHGNGEWPAFIDPLLGDGLRNGYVFTVQVTLGGPNAAPAYVCTGDPLALGRTGSRRFFVDETGVIRFTSDGAPATLGSAPMQ